MSVQHDQLQRTDHPATPEQSGPGERTPDAFAERLMEDVARSLETFSVYVGMSLGLYRALADGGPATAKTVAERAGAAPRYVREWLEQQSVAGVVDCIDPVAPAADRHYRLPAAHEEVLLDRDSLAHAGPMTGMVAGIARVIPDLLEAFTTGAGVPYEAYGSELREGIAFANAPAFRQLLGSEWFPAIPDVHRRLQESPPARVLDLGCGEGVSSLAIAAAYPRVRVLGVDMDEASVREARSQAAAAGLADRVSFVNANAAELSAEGPFDLVTIFEALHDMGDPVGALRAARGLLAEGGLVVIADERVADTFIAPGDLLERINYGWSVLHCLPATVAESGDGNGTVLRSATVHAWAAEAGFTDSRELPVEHELWRFYQLRR